MSSLFLGELAMKCKAQYLAQIAFLLSHHIRLGIKTFSRLTL